MYLFFCLLTGKILILGKVDEEHQTIFIYNKDNLFTQK